MVRLPAHGTLSSPRTVLRRFGRSSIILGNRSSLGLVALNVVQSDWIINVLNATFDPSILAETVAAIDSLYGNLHDDRFYKGAEDIVYDFGVGTDVQIDL